jgi:hypothetical protein
MLKMLEDLANDWRPMWHEWAHPLRPWWRKAEDPFSRLAGMFGGSGASRPLENVWRRVDGQTVATCHPLDERGRPNERVVLGWAFLDPEAAKAGSAEAGRHPESGPFATAEEAMAYVDEHRPLPAPPPMVGQVWAWEDGEQHLVGRTTAVGGLVFLTNGSLFTRADWPPAGAFLVAGPTLWGRDVPWAPVVAK